MLQLDVQGMISISFHIVSPFQNHTLTLAARDKLNFLNIFIYSFDFLKQAEFLSVYYRLYDLSWPWLIHEQTQEMNSKLL